MSEEKKRNERKTRIGEVVSDKMDKTIVVKIEELEQHKLYKKSVKHTVKFKAHDENNKIMNISTKINFFIPNS